MKTNKATTDRVRAVLLATEEAISRLHDSAAAIERSAALIKRRRGDILVTGIGKSRFVGEKFTASLTSLGERAFFIHPTEALHGDLGMLSRGDVLIALSFSGESKEVVDIARYAKKHFGVPVIALCKSATTTLAKIADHVVPLPIEEEGSPNNIAPMASTTATLVACDMIAAAVVRSGFKDTHFAVFHPGGALGLRLKKVRDVMKKGAAIPKIQESSSFLKALDVMTQKKLGMVAVTNTKGGLVGVITDGDVRRFVLKTKRVEKATAKDAMTENPKCVKTEDTLEHALATMERHKITNIFAVDGRGALRGVLHVHDILGHAMG